MESAVLATKKYQSLPLREAFRNLPQESKKRARIELGRRIWIFEPLRLVYVTTPKVGTSSLLRYFHAASGVEDSERALKNREACDPGIAKPKQYGFLPFLGQINGENWIRVAAVRNPYKRILSCFLNKLHGRREISKTGMEAAAEKVGFVDGEGLKFKDFLRHVAQQEPREMNGHWCPQVNMIIPDLINYDKIIRLENFDSDFAKLMNTLNCDYEISDRIYNSTSSHTKLHRFYDDECIELVKAIYAEDFERLGYSLEFPA